MAFFFCYFPWRQCLWWTWCCKMAGSKNQFTVVLLFILSFLTQILAGQSTVQQPQILRLYLLLVLRERKFFILLFHKSRSCMWHTGALCLSPIKMICIPQNVIFTVPDLYITVCVCQHKEVWCTGKAKY
jgi:hypothetical protein